MSAFDARVILGLGWRQGSVLGSVLSETARSLAPSVVQVQPTDWLVVISHDCDVTNLRLDKEPVVELLRATVRKKIDGQQALGRNPRVVQLHVASGESPVVLEFRAHDRWTIPRELLLSEAPDQARRVEGQEVRILAAWLAKRYIRAAFPGAFDDRWRSKLSEWVDLLRRRSAWIQGVYLRLNTMEELGAAEPYGCHLILAVPAEKKRDRDWARQRDAMEQEFTDFWRQFAPAIRCDGIEVLGTDEITLEDINRYQRFDADWVSHADDTERTPPAADMAK